MTFFFSMEVLTTFSFSTAFCFVFSELRKSISSVKIIQIWRGRWTQFFVWRSIIKNHRSSVADEYREGRPKSVALKYIWFCISLKLKLLSLDTPLFINRSKRLASFGDRGASCEESWMYKPETASIDSVSAPGRT